VPITKALRQRVTAAALGPTNPRWLDDNNTTDKSKMKRHRTCVDPSEKKRTEMTATCRMGARALDSTASKRSDGAGRPAHVTSFACLRHARTLGDRVLAGKEGSGRAFQLPAWCRRRSMFCLASTHTFPNSYSSLRNTPSLRVDTGKEHAVSYLRSANGVAKL